MTSTEFDRYESPWGDFAYQERLAALRARCPRRKTVTYSAQARRKDIPRGFCARGCTPDIDRISAAVGCLTLKPGQ
jgi:hypothetical protein